jgi:hypothetical protein
VYGKLRDGIQVRKYPTIPTGTGKAGLIPTRVPLEHDHSEYPSLKKRPSWALCVCVDWFSTLDLDAKKSALKAAVHMRFRRLKNITIICGKIKENSCF